jgi:hypothetical protein
MVQAGMVMLRIRMLTIDSMYVKTAKRGGGKGADEHRTCQLETVRFFDVIYCNFYNLLV